MQRAGRQASFPHRSIVGTKFYRIGGVACQRVVHEIADAIVAIGRQTARRGERNKKRTLVASLGPSTSSGNP
jgi:hypothetical protein